MATLLYAPGVRVNIRTLNDGIIDVTEDIVSGSVLRVENAVSTATISLANPNRKYDRVFTPNDSISIEMKRVSWMPVFTGYLNKVPYFSAWSREVQLEASCTLKRLQHFYWDAYADASVALLDDLGNSSALDGGTRDRVIRIMTNVVGWPSNKIHIGEVPSDWFEKVSDLYDAEVQRQIEGPQGPYINNGIRDILMGGVGAGAASSEFVYPGSNLAPGIAGNPATGVLKDSYGRAGAYGGEDVNNFVSIAQLTGEPVSNFNDEWYCAMRFPFRLGFEEGETGLTPEQVEEAKQWWRNRKLVVVSERTNRSIVVRAADWGPEPSTGYVIGLSRLALGTLGILEGENVRIGFAAGDFPLGAYDSTQLVQPGYSGVNFSVVTSDPSIQYPVPPGISAVSTSSMAWGGYQNGLIRDLSALPNTAGRPLHFLAAEAMVAMQNAARVEANINLTLSSGYRNLASQQRVFQQYGSPRAARPGTSKHGWGFAADINVNESFTSPQYVWLRNNAHRFGWVNPSWARRAGNPEPWHWEFWGVFSYPISVSRLNSNPYYTGAIPDPEPTNEEDSLDNSPQLFNFGLWRPQASRESAILGGPIALTNDSPVMDTLKPLINASMRKFSSAPNGDFIAWFPDYFGVYGTSGRMEVKSIELTDFTMDWDDEKLKTHIFVTGAQYGNVNADIERLGGPVAPILQRFFNMGVATIEQSNIMQALFNIDETTIFSKPLELLRRFGPRVQHVRAPTIASREAEFWLALYNFQQNWASQFSASVPMTFMPELYPGMIMQIPELGFQAYVTSVAHNFDFSNGFTTRVSIIAPSSIGSNGLLGLPKAGLRINNNDYDTEDY